MVRFADPETSVVVKVKSDIKNPHGPLKITTKPSSSPFIFGTKKPRHPVMTINPVQNDFVVPETEDRPPIVFHRVGILIPIHILEDLHHQEEVQFNNYNTVSRRIKMLMSLKGTK